MPEKPKELESIIRKIERGNTCLGCKKHLKFVGDTLNIIHFGCGCPGKMWPFPKPDELKDAYWDRAEQNSS